MPIVDYNRIYHVRSRERQPVLYSPNMVPDRAGAFLRATAPGIRARLEDADARARERQGNLRAQYAALGNLINVGGQVGESYARAVERRDQADFDALAAAWQTHMNNGAEEAYRRPYVRGGENGEGADGPMRAIEELDASFDQSDAFQNARDGVKERFAAWRAKSRIPYANKAAQRQSDLNDLYQKNALEARFASADGKIATFYGVGEDVSFNEAVEEKVNAAVARTAWEYERIGAVLPESERARIAGGIREKALFDRAKYRCAQYAAGDTVPTEDDKELLAAARELSQDGSAITDDTMRLALKNTVSAAKQSRDRNREAYDRQLAEDSAPTLRDAVFADSYEEREAALGKLDGTRASYRTKAGVAAFDERVSKARDASEIRGMRAAYDILMEEQDISNVAGLRAALDNFKRHVDATDNEAAKEFGMKLLSGVGREYDRRTSALVSSLVAKAQYGYDPKTGEPYSVEKLMEDFQGASQYFDPKQAAEFSKAVRDRIQMDGKDVPTQEELALAFQAIGVERDKVPSLFAETDGLFVYDPKEGWRTDPARWKAWDEKTGGKDDIVDLNDRYYESDERNVTREAVDEIMRTMREYCIARYLDGGKNKDLLEGYLQRLRNSRQRLDSMRIIEASREAWNDFHRVGSFQAVGALPWRSPDDPAWGDEEGEE